MGNSRTQRETIDSIMELDVHPAPLKAPDITINKPINPKDKDIILIKTTLVSMVSASPGIKKEANSLAKTKKNTPNKVKATNPTKALIQVIFPALSAFP